MPSIRVNGQSVVVHTFDVVGTDGVCAGFIGHLGLVSKGGEHVRNDVAVVEMVPPLDVLGRMTADAVGTALLSDDETRKIKDYLDRHEGEHKAVQKLSRSNLDKVYCILPHAKPLEEEDGRYVRTRFSCSGLVFEAYKRARILLLDDTRLPCVDIQLIQDAYPDYSAFLDRDRFRTSMGLTGTGPWPVLLCGYLLAALNRDGDAIRKSPHVAQSDDAIFG